MIPNSVLYRSVVRIVYRDSVSGGSSVGSGVIFSSDGLVITNNHIIQNQDFETAFGDIEVFSTTDETKEPSRRHKADLIIRNDDYDLAILKIEGYAEDAFVPIFASEAPISILERRIKVIGYPSLGGSTITVTRGIVSGFAKHRNIKTDAEINPGNSGGGAFYEDDNCFVGIPSFIRQRQAGKIGFIITRERIEEWLNKALIDGIPAGRSFTVRTFERLDSSDNLDRAPRLHRTFGHRVIGQFAAVEGLLRESYFEKALKVLEKIFIQRPRSPLAYQYQGDAYSGLNRNAEAIESYEKSLALNTGVIRTSVWGNYAIALARARRFEKAIEVNNHIVESANCPYEKASACNNIGQIYELLGQIPIAKEYYARSLSIDPGHVIARKNVERLG